VHVNTSIHREDLVKLVFWQELAVARQKPSWATRPV
jgi:hypothetical protein